MVGEQDVDRRVYLGSSRLPADCHPEIREIVDHWQAIRPGAGLPGRQHFDPIDVPHLLPSIRILEVDGDPPRFKTRLMGTKMRDNVGYEQTGKWLDEVYADFALSSAFLGLNAVVETGALNWRRGHPVLFHGKEFMIIERVYLPLARDGATVDMILTYLLFGDTDGNMY